DAGHFAPQDFGLTTAGKQKRLSDCLPGVLAVETPAPPARVDLTIRELAQLFGKQRSTVRAWVERGDFPAAYKLHGKEWRIPVSAVEAFQNRQRRATSNAGLSAWWKVKRSYAPEGPENGPTQATAKS